MNMIESLGELFTAISVMDEVYPKLKDVNDEGLFMSLIGAIIDSWISDHNKTSEDRNRMIATIFHIANIMDDADDDTIKS